MNSPQILGLGLLALLSTACVEDKVSSDQVDNDWYRQAQATLDAKRAQQPNTKLARNVILFIADGHGITSNTALRILDGQHQGANGEEHQLSFEKFPYLALSKTYNTDAQIPDSAGTATAMLTGVKTRMGVLSLDEQVSRGECRNNDQHRLTTAIEMAEDIGMATGIVTTARVTHATPAAAYAHSPERNFEVDSKIPPAQKDDCQDIAKQLIEFPNGDGIDVIMGGGRRNFLPSDVEDVEGRFGIREDEQNLVKQWQEKYPRGQYVQTQDELNQANKKGPLLALFNPSHMAYEVDRINDKGGEPSLAEMTEAAIKRLQNDSQGFFLLVEAARVDHAHHAGNAYRALEDGRAYNDAVARAIELTDSEDTLIIATADHSHTISMAGYSSRGNPILGLSGWKDEHGELQLNKGLDYHPYTTLAYANGPGSASSREHLDQQSAQHKDYKQPSLVPTSSETHGGEDVAIYASGPGAWLFSGTVEQQYIFHVMQHAAELTKKR